MREYYQTGAWVICRTSKGLILEPKERASKPILDASKLEEAIDNMRIAYRRDGDVNWCPALGTVLANEEVTKDGKSERGNHPVEKRKIKQWFIRITDYADRLLAGLDKLDWPNQTLEMQRNWIGKSEGFEIDFPVYLDNTLVDYITVSYTHLTLPTKRIV